MKLSKLQAEDIQKFFCEDKKTPEDVARSFYQIYPRSLFRELWTKENGQKVLKDFDPTFEGHDLIDAAQEALGYITEEKGKRFMATESPFFARMMAHLESEAVRKAEQVAKKLMRGE